MEQAILVDVYVFGCNDVFCPYCLKSFREYYHYYGHNRW
jgi:hypothetical protein